MPSKSKQQQKFFGVVKAMQKGDIPKKGEAGEVADDMTKKEVDKMASTKHKGLVNKIKELVEEEIKALLEAKLPDEGFSDPEQMREAKDLKLDKLFKASKLADIRMGEDNLYKLAMAWEDWNTDNDDQYDELVDPLFAAVEMVQDDTSAGKASATRILKQFQKDVVAAMKEHQDVPDEKEMSLINKARAKAALRQIKSGKRDDGLGVFTDRLFGLNSAGNWMQITDPSDLGFYRKFGLAESVLKEAKSAKALKSDYDKAVKKEQALSSLLLINLEKYKAAKAKGDEKAIAKHTKIAADLSKKKSKATTDASAAYKAYEDKISGLHADAELELKEVKANDDTEFTITLKHLLDKHVAKGGEVNEALPNFKTPFEAYDWIMNKRSEAMDIEMEMLQKTKDIIQTQKDMEQEASPEGGPTTDRYGAVLEKLQMEHEALRKEFSSIMAEIDEYDQN